VPNAAFPPAEDALALADVVVGLLDEITPQLVASRSRPGQVPWVALRIVVVSQASGH
jgi:hypothetical protein